MVTAAALEHREDSARAVTLDLMDEGQSVEEIEAHFGPDGPVAASTKWITLVQSGDLQSAWSLTDPHLRLIRAQAWLWANRDHPMIAPYDRDDAATRLSGLAFDHPLWEAFEETQIGEFHEAWPDFDLESWGVASRPRPVPPDLEVVVYMRTGGEVQVIAEPSVLPARSFLLRSTPDGWLMFGFNSTDPGEPGWPPRDSQPEIV